jgi:hypothetical protein
MTMTLRELELSTRLATDAFLRVCATVLWWGMMLAGATLLIAFFNTAFAATRGHHAHPKHHPHHRHYAPLAIDAAAPYSRDDRYPWLTAAPVHTASVHVRGSERPQRRARSATPPQRARARREASFHMGGLVTVSTAAGISITVAASFEPKIMGFISDLVARGYHPPKIHCYATGGHVAHSLHYSGHACDFNQRGWGLTDRPMYHVAALVAKWGLRDGGEFMDWGHIDDGPHLNRRARVAAVHATPFYGPTSEMQDRAHRRRYASARH